MTIGVGSTIRTSCIAENFNGETVVTTWDVRVTTAGTGGITGVREDIRDFINDMYTNVAGYISGTVVPQSLEFYSRLSADYIPPIDWTGMTFTGSGQELPANCSGYIVIPTATRGVRGRKFFFNTVEAYNSVGLPDSAFKAAMVAVGADWLNSSTGTNGWDFQGVVWSTKYNLAYLPVDITAGDQWGTTTRRKVGN